MAIGLSKAFDTLNHTKLVGADTKTPRRTAMQLWAGVPQGSVISPLLLNFSSQVTRQIANYSLHTLTSPTQWSYQQIST